jgi:quercetin dioxygenase-like cupin family protein
MFISNDDNVVLDRTDSMYPCEVHKITNGKFTVPKNSTVYGFCISGEMKVSDTKTVAPNEFFSINSRYSSNTIIVNGVGFCIVKFGYHGQNVFGGPIEKQGRLCYIDHCSDSLLVYPPRMGDPSLSSLHFPPGIVQTFHTHPSFRLGIVASGKGYAQSPTYKHDLTVGSVFCMEEQEVHRFVTEDSGLIVISFHPDGDWGPTDHDHTLLNRTYLTQQSGK